MKNLITLFILIFLSGSLSGQQMVTKVIVIQGDLHQKLNLYKKGIQIKLDREMKKRGFTIVENQIQRRNPDSTMYIAEIYVYQYIAENPVINFIIRSEQGIHFEKWTTVFAMVNTRLAIEASIDELYPKIPLKLDLSKAKIFKAENRQFYEPPDKGLGVGEIINVQGINVSEEMIGLDYFIPGGFQQYLNACINLKGIASDIVGPGITITFDINERGEAVFTNAYAPIKFNKRKVERIKGIVDAFPIFKVDKAYSNLYIKIQPDYRTNNLENRRATYYKDMILRSLLISLVVLAIRLALNF